MRVPQTLLGLLERGPSCEQGTTTVQVTYDVPVADREVVVRDGTVSALAGVHS